MNLCRKCMISARQIKSLGGFRAYPRLLPLPDTHTSSPLERVISHEPSPFYDTKSAVNSTCYLMHRPNFAHFAMQTHGNAVIHTHLGVILIKGRLEYCERPRLCIIRLCISDESSLNPLSFHYQKRFRPYSRRVYVLYAQLDKIRHYLYVIIMPSFYLS